MTESYDLALVKGKSFYGDSYADVLQAVADFAKEMEAYTIVSVNLGYSDGHVLADVMYEG